jgi:hypothetical protein
MTSTVLLPFQPDAMTPTQLAAVSYLARYTDPRTTQHYDRARGNLDRHGVHFLTAYVAGVQQRGRAAEQIMARPCRQSHSTAATGRDVALWNRHDWKRARRSRAHLGHSDR